MNIEVIPKNYPIELKTRCIRLCSSCYVKVGFYEGQDYCCKYVRMSVIGNIGSINVIENEGKKKICFECSKEFI